MVFVFREKEKECFRVGTDFLLTINCQYEFLPDKVCDKMFFGRANCTYLPEYTGFFQETVKQVFESVIKTLLDYG